MTNDGGPEQSSLLGESIPPCYLRGAAALGAIEGATMAVTLAVVSAGLILPARGGAHLHGCLRARFF